MERTALFVGLALLAGHFLFTGISDVLELVASKSEWSLVLSLDIAAKGIGLAGAVMLLIVRATEMFFWGASGDREGASGLSL
jgi:hypothetical protein